MKTRCPACKELTLDLIMADEHLEARCKCGYTRSESGLIYTDEDERDDMPG